MNDAKKPGKNDPQDEETTALDSLSGRRFELAEAIGRQNADMLKGASPVARGRQVLFEIEQFLEDRLYDPDGSLLRTLLARLRDDAPLLGRHFDHPLGALTEALGALLQPTPAAKHALAELVRDTDARWGREYQERPRFESEGRPPAADDPYTTAQVRSALEELQRTLAE